MENKKVEQNLKQNKVLTIIGIVLCVILLPILIVNITLIIKGFTSDEVPSLGNNIPLIVLTESMEPEINGGDLIVIKKAKPSDIEKDDVIAFIDPMGNGTSIVTHRVLDVIENEDGTISWQTKGDNNPTEDKVLVPEANLVGEWHGTRIPFLGSIAMFMQTTTGLILCVFLPILLVIGYDILRRRMAEKNNKQDTDALLAELAELRAQKAAQEEKKASEEVIENVPESEVIKEEVEKPAEEATEEVAEEVKETEE